MVKSLPVKWKTRAQSLRWEDPLEKAMATHSSILAWKIPWIEKPGRLQSMGSQRVRHDWVTSLSLSIRYKCENWTIKKPEHRKIDPFVFLFFFFNWCFWTVVLEKTRESTLDCKEIKPVNPKGNQSWISIGRTDAEDEATIPWPPDAKSWLIGKDPDAGKDWRQEKKGMKGWDGWMASLAWWTWVWANSGRQERTGKPGMLQSMGSKIAGHDLATEQQQSAGRSCSISQQVIWEKGKFPPNTLQDIAEKWKPA